ncbi:MAG TPA: hypothetical protein VFL14_03145 [Xanthomonadales bacterium]|nr:hypothetical protein [Xanthomonadales bacterium]
MGTTIPLGDIEPGDVLMALGHGEISKLLAWNGESDYSHAMLVVDGGNLVEATTGGCKIVPLTTRQRQSDRWLYVDVWRPVAHDGRAFDADDRAAIVANGRTFAGLPYAMDVLTQLAIVVAVRNKTDMPPAVKAIVRVIVDSALKDDPTHLTCTELVYRGLRDAQASPEHRLRPKIVVAPKASKPFPKVDVIALWKETKEMFGKRKAAPQAPGLRAAAPALSDAPPAPSSEDDAALDAGTAHLRKRLGVKQPVLRAPPAGPGARPPEPIEIRDPAPRGIIPLDFVASPSFTKLGSFPMKP